MRPTALWGTVLFVHPVLSTAYTYESGNGAKNNEKIHKINFYGERGYFQTNHWKGEFTSG
jgi:hypothetical protein